MQIKLDKIELNGRISGLALKSHYHADLCDQLYYDTELEHYMVLVKTDKGHKYTGKIMVPPHNVACAQISEQSIPKHQPIGTPESHDTPTGRRVKGSVSKAKTVLADRIEARKTSTPSAE